MKIIKIPGLGNFGAFIDDLDLDNITDEEWKEIGNIHLNTLVTIFRNVKIKDVQTYERLMSLWGAPRHNRPLHFYEKYGKKVKELVFSNELDDADRQTIMNARSWQVNKKLNTVRVTPKKDFRGKNMGIFGDGELKWHSNECGDVFFTPGVALLGRECMTNSCTGFVTTPDWYAEQSESFRSELDDMIIIHNYRPSMINPEYVDSQESFYKDNMCPDPNSRIPLVIKNPIGIKGIHLGINTFDYIEGMNKEDSNKIFSYIEKTLFVDKYIYKHWYQQDNDLCLFDNSITLHNREIKDNGTAPDRIGWRLQYDFTNIAGEYNPYFQNEFNDMRKDRNLKYLQAIA